MEGSYGMLLDAANDDQRVKKDTARNVMIIGLT